MTAVSEVKGHPYTRPDLMAAEYHFVTEPPTNRFCPICFELLIDPFLNDCGHHLCRQCRNQLLAAGKKECPECPEPGVTIRWTGPLDWTSGLDYWTDLCEIKRNRKPRP